MKFRICTLLVVEWLVWVRASTFIFAYDLWN